MRLMRLWLWTAPLAMLALAALFGWLAVDEGKWGLLAAMVVLAAVAVGLFVVQWRLLRGLRETVMRHESPLLLWAALPVLAMLRECSGSPRRKPVLGVGFDTLIRLAVWTFLGWSAVRGEWSAVIFASVVIVGLSMTALGFRWYANRKGWRQRWLKN